MENLSKVNIKDCVNCDSDHYNLVTQQLKNDPDGYTHVAECPNTKKPIFVKEMLNREKDPQPWKE